MGVVLIGEITQHTLLRMIKLTRIKQRDKALAHLAPNQSHEEKTQLKFGEILIFFSDMLKAVCFADGFLLFM